MIYPMTFTPWNWYWLDAKGQLYSSKENALVAATSADYVAWCKAGNYATLWPKDANGNETTASLNTVLAANNLPAYVPATPANTGS